MNRSSLTLYAGGSFFDAVFALVYTAKPKLFRFSFNLERLPKFTFIVECKEPPRVTLGPGRSDSNILLEVFFGVNVKIKDGKPWELFKRRAQIFASFAFADDTLQLNVVKIALPSAAMAASARSTDVRSELEKLFEEALDLAADEEALVAEAYEGRIGAHLVKMLEAEGTQWANELPLPSVMDVYSEKLPLKIRSATVQEVAGQYLLCLNAAVFGQGGDQAIPLPDPFPFDFTKGIVAAFVSQEAVNFLVEKLLRTLPSPYRFKRTWKILFFRAGIKSRILIDRPWVRLLDKKAIASARLRFRRSKVGIREFGHWCWDCIRIPTIKPRLVISLNSGDKVGVLSIKVIERIRGKIKRLGVDFDVSRREVNKKLKKELSTYQQHINSHFHRNKVELFNMPPHMPLAQGVSGSTIPATLTFANEDQGISFTFVPGAVMAVIELATQPEAASPQEALDALPPEPAAPDDLKEIKGIGQKVSEVLYAAGITTFAELARTEVSRLKEILEEAGPRYRITDPTTWTAQAAEKAGGE